MSREERDAANEQIADPPDVTLTDSARLGLYVVGRLAQRHGIRVSLKDSSPYSGTTGVVLIPQELIEETEPGTDAPAPAAEPQPVRYHVAPTRVEAVAAGPDSRSGEGAGLPIRVRQASVAAPGLAHPTGPGR